MSTSRDLERTGGPGDSPERTHEVRRPRTVAAALGRTLLVAIAAAALSAVMARPAAAAAPTKGKAYAFESLESLTSVSFRVSRRGRTLEDIFLNVPLRCSNGRDGFALFLGFEPPTRLPIARDGSFSGTLAVGREPLDPFAASEQYWLSGMFTRAGKTARVTLRAQQVGEGGTVCDSGDHRVTARRQPGKRR